MNKIDIEGSAKLLLAELENGVALGYSFPSRVILAMNSLKKALTDSDKETGRMLNNLHLRLIKDEE